MSVIKYDESNSRVLFWLIAAGALFMGALVVAPFLPAIMWATVLAVLTHPLYTRVKNSKLCTGRNWGDAFAAVCVTLGTLLLLILPILAFGTVAALELSKVLRSDVVVSHQKDGTFTLLGMSAELDKMVEPVLSQIPVQAVQEFRLSDFIRENGDQLSEAIQGPAVVGLKRFGMAAFSAIVALLTLFFMLKDSHKLLEPSLKIIPLPREESMKILVRLRETVWSVFMGVVFVALIQGALGGAAYAVLGVPSPVIWAMATFICAMIPLVGPPVVFVPLSLVLFFQGKPGQAVGLVLFGALVLSQVDNILRPFFIGARSSLHPMAVFFSLLGGALLMGPIGLMAGPIILTLCIIVAEVIMVRRDLIDGRLVPGSEVKTGEASVG